MYILQKRLYARRLYKRIRKVHPDILGRQLRHLGVLGYFLALLTENDLAYLDRINQMLDIVEDSVSLEPSFKKAIRLSRKPIAILVIATSRGAGAIDEELYYKTVASLNQRSQNKLSFYTKRWFRLPSTNAEAIERTNDELDNSCQSGHVRRYFLPNPSSAQEEFYAFVCQKLVNLTNGRWQPLNGGPLSATNQISQTDRRLAFSAVSFWVAFNLGVPSDPERLLWVFAQTANVHEAFKIAKSLSGISLDQFRSRILAICCNKGSGDKEVEEKISNFRKEIENLRE